MGDAATTGDWITAFATLIAAGGTVGALIYAAKAAKAASASAKAASESAAAANKALQHEALPLSLDVPYEHYTVRARAPVAVEHEDGTRKTPMRGQIGLDGATGTFAIPVGNVRRGVARIENFEISIAKTGEAYAQHGGQALPVGEEIWLAGRPVQASDFLTALQRTPSPLHECAPVIFTVTYTDNSGQQRQRFEMMLGSRGQESAWRVLRTANMRTTTRGNPRSRSTAGL